MKKLLILFISILTLIISKESQATHIMAMDMTYECLGNNEYLIKLSIFRDCDGVALGDDADIILSSPCWGSFFETIERDTTFQILDVTQICSSDSSTCAGGTIPGVEQHVYSGVVNLFDCEEWIVSYENCCKNGSITNTFDDPLNLGAYIEMFINNDLGNCNNSPVFNALPVPYMCIDQLTNYSHSVYDAEGDQLVFTLVNPLDQGANLITLDTGFTPDNPIGTSVPGGFTIDSLSGQITMEPDAFEIAIFTVLVEEYDSSGTLIGAIMRDMQVIIIDCTNQNPAIDSIYVENSLGGYEVLTDLDFAVCAGDGISFDFVASDLDSAQIVAIASTLDFVADFSSITCVGDNPTTCTVEADFNNTGVYAFTIEVEDDNCPTPAIQYYNFLVDVVNAGLEVNKISLQDTVLSGDTAFFQIDIINSGTADLVDIVIDDLQIWADDCSGLYYDDGTVLAGGDTLSYICYGIPTTSGTAIITETNTIGVNASTIDCFDISGYPIELQDTSSVDFILVPDLEGCTDPLACNYDPNALYDDGSCAEFNCLGDCGGGDPAGLACDDGDPTTDNDVYDSYCNCTGTPIQGCTDPDACNYNPYAGSDDGSCLENDCEGVCGGTTLPGSPCDDGDAYTINDMYDANCDCVGELIEGCTDPLSCTYDAYAGIDDGSCLYEDCLGVCGGTSFAGTPCDDGDPLTVNDVLDDDCDCAGQQVPGCLDPFAENYDPTATVEDGSCIYNCDGAAGTVMVNNLYICEGDLAIADADDFLLMPGQSVFYFYHQSGMIDSTDIPLQNIITDGSFLVNDGSVAGDVYITAIGIGTNPDGTPNWSDPCLTISNTILLSFMDPIMIDVETICNTDLGEFTYSFTITGGLPEVDNSQSYDVVASVFNGMASYNELITVGPLADLTSLDILVTDGSTCETTYSELVECEKVPVELIAFSGSAEDSYNLLEWSVASEIENDFYTLSKSFDAMNYSPLAIIDGAGTVSSSKSYAYQDSDVQEGTAYYRLEQTDFDGTTVSLGIVVLDRKETDLSFDISISPIPAHDVIYLTMNSSEEMNLSITDLSGKELISIGEISSGIDISTLPTGLYFLRAEFEGMSESYKFVKE